MVLEAMVGRDVEKWEERLESRVDATVILVGVCEKNAGLAESGAV